MDNSDTTYFQIKIPRSLFVELKVISLQGKHRGVGELIQPEIDQFVAVLVEKLSSLKKAYHQPPSIGSVTQ